MKFQLLPSTIEDGIAVNKQHLACFVIDDRVAIDAGCLSISSSEVQKRQIRDVVLTHAHIDHVAGLPLFIDDLFSELESPVRVHSSEEIIDVLRKNIFNWEVYPDFSELRNSHGPVLEYNYFDSNQMIEIGDLRIKAIPVNHKVPSFGFVISGGKTKIALSGDTAEMNEFWTEINSTKGISAVFIECAFPDELEDLAQVSHHFTPARLENELRKFELPDCPVYVINIKPVYRDATISQLHQLDIPNLHIMDVGKVYEF